MRKFLIFVSVVVAMVAVSADDLATVFATPPKTARPETWFHLINGNISKEGLSADLEAISAAGISGIQLFHGSRGSTKPWPGVTNSVACLSPQWEDHILHAANECRRLGLTYRMQNCPGWSMSGGPWIRSGQAMRRLVTSRAYVQGGKTVKTRLALRGPNVKGIATLAFRCPAGDVNPFTKEPGFLKPVAVTGGGTLANAWRDLFLKDKAFGLPAGNWTVELDFGKPVMLRTLETPGVRSMSYDKCYSDGVLLSAVRIEPDGQETKLGSWRNPRSNWQDRGCWSIALADDKPTRKLRLTIETQYVIKLSRFTFLSQAHPDNFEGVSGRTLRSLVRREHATLDPAACVNPAEVIDLTAMTDAQGNVTWNDAPAGDWLIFRLGHARENKCIYPAPPGATGFECDKLSPHGIETTFAGYIGHLTDPKTGVLRGGLLKGAIFDSWECETQNWTPGLDAAFEKHYGYKLLPWMPAVLGYVVKDRESTDRFLRDWRVFLGDCIEKNFFGRFAQLCHARGLDASFETAFGDVVPGDILGYYRYCDVPMCEYWQPKHAKLVGDSETKDVRPTVSAAKMYGKRRVAAEAFTSGNLTWNEHPRFFKSYHDEHYALGVTHPVFHTYTHHPQTDGFKRPGTSFGGNIGSPFLRGQTWWRHMASFTEYIARCTALAEAGDTVADVLYYLGDEANAKPPFTLADLPPTYHYDYCNQDALLNRIAVKDGKWVLPEGGAYAVLWLPDCKRLMPETLEKIRAGVKQGARVCGRRPDAPATLAGGAALEAKFAELRDAIWGGAFADRVSEGAITAALTAAGCSPDVTVTTADGRDWSQRTRDGKEGLAWSHRVAKGRHWYFFAAPAERSFAGTVKLRGGATRRFAFWDATTGRRTAATTKPLPDGSVEIALNLGASESVFVVEVADGAPAPTTVDALTETTLTAPWRVTFEKGWGRDEPIEMTQLAAWCDLPGDDEAKAYSGTATYATTFTLERTGGRLVLDLGRVEMIAAVRVNGKAAGTLWTWPYRVDVTDLVTSGVNTLEIDVISTWYNRLAYDESLPVAQRKTWSRNVPKADSARVPYGLLGPVTFHSADRISLSAGATSVDETRLLQGEIDRLAAAGGGTLRVQPGVHRSGALFFKPGVNLHLEKGAVIQGVDEAAAYPWRETRMIGMTLNYFPALINADRCDGFTITGEGVIDGHGLPVWKAFWPRYHAAQAKKKPWDDVFNGLTRPRVLYVSNSRNVDVSGVTFKNSKFWTTHYYRCANVTVHDCRIVAEKLDGVMGPSTDAIDIDVCTNIVVRRVYMDVKDDAVVVKGGRGPDANKVEKGNGETVNVLVEDCTFGPLCHACLTLGSECPAARNIRMRNCRVEGANALARVKMRGDTPQHLTDFVVENCTGRCDRFLMFGAFAASEHWPEFRRRPLPSVMDRLELRGNKIDCRVKYDCHAVPWLTLKEYIEEDNAVNARYKGNPGCTRGARCRGSSARTPVTLEVGPNRAYKTIQEAADVAKAGDTVLIDPGVYREWVKPAHAGTKEAPITYRAREKGKVIITGADVIVGWKKRADGFWEVKLPYDRFGGLNPFSDFIYGNWYYPPKGVRNPRTNLFRGRRQMCFRERLGEFGQAYSQPEYLVNVAGLTVNGRTIPGASAELSGGIQLGKETKWGREIGMITPGATAAFGGFSQISKFTLHASSALEGRIAFHDGRAEGPLLGEIEIPFTDVNWAKFTPHEVTLARVPASGKLVMVFGHRTCYGKRSYGGSYLLQQGMAAGTIVADFKDDPNDGQTELVVRPCCFYPIQEGRDYIRLEGLVLRDAGPNFAGPHSEQLALVGTNWSKGWVIEDCEISGSPCAGITLGKYGDAYDNYSNNSQRFTEAIGRALRNGWDAVGHHTVRRCRIRDCGQVGICGSLGAVFSTIEGCDIGYCHWNASYGGCEHGCIKIHAAVDVLIKDNDLHHAGTVGAKHRGTLGGIWLDWMAQGTRITGNFIHDLCLHPDRTADAGIFVEVSHGPVLIDNNVILAERAVGSWGTRGIACIGNVFAGKVSSESDPRRTPMFEPHSVRLREMTIACGNGDHRHFNNIMAFASEMKEDVASVAEDNILIPLEKWSFGPDGSYRVPVEGKPHFKPVNTARLGRTVLGKQAFENRDGTPYVWEVSKMPPFVGKWTK